MMMSTGQVRILIADDHEMMRRALRSYLQSRSGWEVIGEAVDGRDAIAKALQLHPDVIVMDVTMPKLNGLDAARIIHEQDPQPEILIVTQHELDGLAQKAVEAGASGYIAKSQNHARSPASRRGRQQTPAGQELDTTQWKRRPDGGRFDGGGFIPGSMPDQYLISGNDS